MTESMTRRHFVGAAAGTAAWMAGGQVAAAPKQPLHNRILNFHGAMEYRPLGSTGLRVSVISLGGHRNPKFIESRDQLVDRAMELGINYIDACTGPEVLAYGRVLKGRRGMMHLGYSRPEREPWSKEWRSKNRLIDGLDLSLREAGLSYVDLWRITLPVNTISDSGEIARIEAATVEALSLAKKEGKACFTGVSLPDRVWLKSMIERYSKHLEVVVLPYTPRTRVLPGGSVLEAIGRRNVGVLALTPFAGSALFQADHTPAGPYHEEDDTRVRLALRHALGNSIIASAIPGMADAHQVENAALAVMTERRKLDQKERAELERMSGGLWARPRPDCKWLNRWEYV